MITDDSEGSSSKEQVPRPVASAPVHHVPPLARDSIPSTAAAIEASTNEAQALADGKLEAIAAQNSHRRREDVRNLIHRMKLIFLVALGLLLLAAIVIVSIHYMSPWGFLSKDQLSTLQTILASSVISSVATFGAKSVTNDL